MSAMRESMEQDLAKMDRKALKQLAAKRVG